VKDIGHEVAAEDLERGNGLLRLVPVRRQMEWAAEWKRTDGSAKNEEAGDDQPRCASRSLARVAGRRCKMGDVARQMNPSHAVTGRTTPGAARMLSMMCPT